jgi:hypothetical protein
MAGGCRECTVDGGNDGAHGVVTRALYQRHTEVGACVRTDDMI